MRYLSYLSNATLILEQYHGAQPFSIYLKQYFAQHKKFGSNDRKQITRLCYAFFRLGHALKELPVADRIIAGVFAGAQGPDEGLQQLKPEWNELVGLSLEEKLASISQAPAAETLTRIFPWTAALSEGIDRDAFLRSFLVQPDLFLRLRPGQEKMVKTRLEQEGLTYEALSDRCLALPNSSRADKAVLMDKEAVIQDYSSQRVGEMMLQVRERARGPLRVWDCCAGSGGKSIMAWDLLGNIRLTVSDKRESILNNLRSRFRTAGIGQYTALAADLSTTHSPLPAAGPSSFFNFIIADVPCSGSGTWGRTPEQLYYFSLKTAEQYSERQKKIVQTALRHLEPGGFFLYITCSVFRQENEAVVDFIRENSSLELLQMELYKGYDRKADTLFAALFQLPEL